MRERDDVSIRDRQYLRNLWLGIGLSVHIAATAVIILAVAAGIFQSVLTATGALALALASPLSAIWYERRRTVRNRPAKWLQRAVEVALPHATAFGVATSAMFAEYPWLVRTLAPLLLVAVAQVGCVTCASRAMRYPLTPELGEMGVEVEVRIRATDDGPALASQHDVRLTDSDIVTTIRPSLSHGVMTRIPLKAVKSVAARPARPKDSPWTRLPDGKEYFVTSGDVVEIRYRGGSAVLPVCNASAFAAVVRTRLHAMNSCTHPTHAGQES